MGCTRMRASSGRPTSYPVGNGVRLDDRFLERVLRLAVLELRLGQCMWAHIQRRGEDVPPLRPTEVCFNLRRMAELPAGHCLRIVYIQTDGSPDDPFRQYLVGVRCSTLDGRRAPRAPHAPDQNDPPIWQVVAASALPRSQHGTPRSPRRCGDGRGTSDVCVRQNLGVGSPMLHSGATHGCGTG